MGSAEELLNSMAEDGISAYTATPETEPHIVIGPDRFITVPDELKRIAVQFDHNIETVTFDGPRYWDGHDMSEMKVYINYMRADRVVGSYIADNVVADETDASMMHFDWTISKNVTLVNGGLVFLVCVKKSDENGSERNHWNSELNKDLYISEGLEANDNIMEMYPDVINGLLTRMDNILHSGMVVDVNVVKEDGIMTITLTAPEGTETFVLYDGVTPHIGDNGNWWIGDEDTGVVASASDRGFMMYSVYDPQGKETDVFEYVENYVATYVQENMADVINNIAALVDTINGEVI